MIAFYVVTANPSDFPGKYVLRRHVADGGELVPDREPVAVSADLEQVRAAVPAGMKRISPVTVDDPAILEWYADEDVWRRIEAA